MPFIEQCLFVLFPLPQLQKVLNVPQNEMNKLKRCLRLDIDDLLVELKELIPVKEDTYDQPQIPVSIPETDNQEVHLPAEKVPEQLPAPVEIEPHDETNENATIIVSDADSQ